jgi:hypothetical protein
MKRTPLAVCVLAVVLSSGGMAAEAAAPDPTGGGGGTAHKPSGCVNKREYGDVEIDMTRTRVHRVFGTNGKRTSISHNHGQTTEVRTYKVCKSPDSTVTGSYGKHGRGPLRLTNKTAVWVDSRS